LLPLRVTFFGLQHSAIRADAPVRGDDFGAVYEDNVRLLVGTAMDRYHISEIDAEALAHEVFLAYFLKADEVIDLRAWLVSGICNASKHYLRSRARLLPLSDDFSESPDPRRQAENLPDQLVAREAFACVTAKCQIALRLYYIEGYSMPEVAEELKTSAKYADKLVRRCLKQAQRRYAKKSEER
jgi:RNA polymerase sigma factor (sigma-70 family)